MNHITYYKENFDETKARFQQWWKGNSLGRPMLALSARRERPLPVDPPEPFADLTDKYTNVERQISHFRFNAAHRSYLGESFPALNVVWGLPLLAEYFGGERKQHRLDARGVVCQPREQVAGGKLVEKRNRITLDFVKNMLFESAQDFER